MLRTPRIVVAVLAALALGTASASAADWVGLGDSYAAGPLIPNQQLNPLGCLRSDHNYAHLSAPDLGLALHDPSCSGAETEDMTNTQGVSPQPNPPQFARRWTFYIGPDGRILYIDKTPGTQNAGQNVIAKLKELGVKEKK